MEKQKRSNFATTRWTLVERAVHRGETGGMEALGELLQAYWQPLYRHARRKGKSKEDAQDLVQGFYAHLMAGSPFASVDRSRGRFRSFLLGAFTNYMINDWHHENRLKRGGGEVPLSLDWEQAETGLRLEIADEHTPEREFDRDWAHSLLRRVMQELEEGCRREGSLLQFEHLRTTLTADSAKVPYADLAAKLDTSEGAARVAVHRLRKRYRQLLRDEIGRTLEEAGSVEEEMASLFAALAN
ncbi:MAG TPA: sigma-70 family RNA polymerase sigma factor [Opitutales bacterium]|nr:sigma-70 family RNA polymerase sigma factor [Opitutales bacterium]